MTTLSNLLPRYTFAEQRAQCEACAHLQRATVSTTTSSGPPRALLCAAAKGTWGCSLMRAPGRPCGPEAALFKPRTPA